MRPGESFRRKIEVLETWAHHGGPPAGSSWPRRPEELRRWHSEELGITPWTSRNLAAPNGPYPDLRLRFDTVVKRLAAAEGRRSGAARARAPEVAESKLKVKQLCEQVVLLQADIRYLQRQLENSRSQLAEERELTSELKKELSVLKPFTRARQGA